jgi:hypothetical protein
MDWLFNLDLWLLVKLAYILAALIYLVFAVVVIRQVGLMARTLYRLWDQPLKLIAWIHFILALLAVVMALLIL